MGDEKLKHNRKANAEQPTQADVLHFLKEAQERGSFASEAPRETLPDGRIRIGPYSTPHSPLQFVDTWTSYKGGFEGSEEIHYRGSVVWHREYVGKLLDEKHGQGELHAKLSEVLRVAQKSAPAPYMRGPKQMQVGEYVYKSQFLGDLQAFAGFEKIMHDNVKIFTLNYAGGLVRRLPA